MFARLRDLSTQDKAELQRASKDLEKHVSLIVQLKENKDKLEHEIQVRGGEGGEGREGRGGEGRGGEGGGRGEL